MDAPEAPQRPVLIPEVLTDDEVAEATELFDDPWVRAACDRVVSYLATHRGEAPATPAPFALRNLRLGGDPWRARGVGRTLNLPGGAPLWIHRPGQWAFCVAREAVTVPRGSGQGQVCYIAGWFRSSGRPRLIEVWELLFTHEGTDAQACVYWRPDFTLPRKPKVVAELTSLGRKKEQAVLRDIWDLLEGKPKGGRGLKPPDPKFERDLESVVRKLILDREGAPFSVEDLVTHLLPGQAVSTYYRALERHGLRSEQVQAWITDCLRDFHDPDGDNGIAAGSEWQLPIRLAALPRSFRE